MKRVSFQALACVTVLCTGLLLLNGCSDANQDTAEASSSSTAVTTTTTPTAAPTAKEIKPVAWHSEIEKSLPTLLGDESSRYAVYAFYPNSDSKPLIYQSRPMRSASMIKVFILGKAMADVEKGALSLDEPIILHDRDKVGGAGVIAGWADGTAIPISQLLRLMITESDNTATNLMIDRLGMDAINEYMQAKGYKDSKLARKMMDTAAAAAGRENMTSVNDLGTYFTRLWRQEGMSDASRTFMLDCLYGQTDTECFPQAFPDAKIAHKTGELAGLYDDGGIIVRRNGPLVLVIMDDDIDSRGGTIHKMQKVAQRIGAVNPE